MREERENQTRKQALATDIWGCAGKQDRVAESKKDTG